MSESAMNYDPNMVMCGRIAKQVVRLTFGLWDYRAEMTETVGGNCTGFTVVEAAIKNVYEKLLGDHEYASITLTKPDGDTLFCDEDVTTGYEWLKAMLVSAEIVSITPDEPDQDGHPAHQ